MSNFEEGGIYTISIFSCNVKLIPLVMGQYAKKSGFGYPRIGLIRVYFLNFSPFLMVFPMSKNEKNPEFQSY